MKAEPPPPGVTSFVRLEPPRGPGLAIVGGVLAVVVAAGVLGRLVPSSQPAASTTATGSASQAAFMADGFRLASPIGDVLWLRTTEIRVRGTAKAAAGPLDIRLLEPGPGGETVELGRASIEVLADGTFDGVLPFIPPATRTNAILSVVAQDGTGDALAEVAVSIEAGSLLLVREPTRLRGRPGGVLVVDLLVYSGVPTVEALLTSRAGVLIASTERRLAIGADDPRLIALRVAIPGTGVPDRAQLHLIGLDADGFEVEHIDLTVPLDGR